MISPQMSDLSTLPNIGKKIEASLNEIGVHSREDLEKMGSIEAWHRMRAKHPQKDTCICALYALEGALTNNCWHELPEPVKEELQIRVGKL